MSSSCLSTYDKNNIKYNKTNISTSLFYSDIDECSADTSPCDENADCTNTDGSYSCTCKQGFTGNGAVCEGIQNIRP